MQKQPRLISFLLDQLDCLSAAAAAEEPCRRRRRRRSVRREENKTAFFINHTNKCALSVLQTAVVTLLTHDYGFNRA